MASDRPPVPRKDVSEGSVAVYRSSTQAGPSSPSQYHINNDSERPNTPPPYSGPTTPLHDRPLPPPGLKFYPGIPRLDYRLYSPTSFTLSSDKTTITTHSPALSTSPTALLSIIQSLATVPPKPQVRIVGTLNGILNFDIKLNLMRLILPEEEKRKMNYVKIIGNQEKGFRGDVKETLTPTVTGLEGWVRKYCEDSGAIKHFALQRIITNWDTSYIEGRLLALINSTGYSGQVAITFPITHSNVIIHSPDKVNRFFSNVTKVFTGTRKYEVVKSIWPYADLARGEAGRKCCVQEEETWFTEWSDAIRYAVVAKRRGWVTSEDRLEFLMEPRVGENPRMED